MKILDIRGTHGSGKSHIPSTLLKNYYHEEINGYPLTYDAKNKRVVGYYIPDLHTYILGSYHNTCGGCDGIKTQLEIKARIDYFSERGNVILEGILVAHTFGPWLEYSEGKDYHFLFLDTPLQTCIDRVNHRRAQSGKEPLEDPKNIIRDYHRITSLMAKFKVGGRSSEWLDYLNPIPRIVELLK